MVEEASAGAAQFLFEVSAEGKREVVLIPLFHTLYWLKKGAITVNINCECRIRHSFCPATGSFVGMHLYDCLRYHRFFVVVIESYLGNLGILYFDWLF
jgi:hypothetical protein